MSIFAYKEARNWFEGRIKKLVKNKKISIIIILIIISGCFFYIQLLSIFPECFADSYKKQVYSEHEEEWIVKINYIESKTDSQKGDQNKIYSIGKEMGLKELKDSANKELENQLYQLVGSAPIREMIPAILKLDYKAGAFVIGIAKKESNWGKRAPSQGGKTCYNYWGYKGIGSRGTSMGYACFGSPEEAVAVVGKRIENLIAKNINDPRKFVVWKCGSSCAGHDPGAVQKWISDVSLYYGKVMKLQNS